MKKSSIIILLFSLLFQVNAGKKFYKIGNYSKVEILKITAKGIQVLHSYGIGYITDENLSESEKKLLQPEIEQYHKLKNIRAANIEKITNSQTQELDDLIKRLPGMKYNELQAWSKKRVGISFNDKKFPARLNSTFYYADNKAAFQKALKKRIVTLYNEYLKNLSKMLCKKTPDAIDRDCQKLFGRKYSDRNFRSKLKQRLSYATNFDYFFNSVDKSIENYYKAEKRRKEEEKRARIAEERRKEEEKRARIAEERRKEEEKRARIAEERQEKENTSRESKKKETLKLEFLGISVNESAENIKAHLLNRGFKFPGSYKELLTGRFWLLKEPSIAEIHFDSGKIRIAFVLDPTASEQALKNLRNLAITRDEAVNSINELNKLESIAIRRYFDTLQRKYGKAQLEDKNIIVLTDGLIEYKPPFTAMLGIVYSSNVVFYNRKAAEKRLQEIKAKNDELRRQYNDI